MSKHKTIDEWLELVESGVRYRELYGNSKNWHTYRNYGRGIFPTYDGSTNGTLPYNLVYTHEKALIPNVYYRNPYITVSGGYNSGLNMQAKIIEAVDNWLIGEIDIKSQMKTAIRDAYYCNKGIIKLGYDSTGIQPSSLKDDISQLLSMKNKSEDKIEYNVNIKPGMPWAVRVQPDFFVVPFGVRVIEDCPWVDHYVIRVLEDVKNDPMYTNVSGLEGTHLELLHKNMYSSQFYSEWGKNVKLVEVHEIRDYKKKEIKTFIPGHEGWIRKPMEDVLQIEGLPFVDFSFNEDTEYYWGPSDVQIMEPQQLEVNEARTQAMLHRRVALVKFLVEENMISDDEIEKMVSENVAPIIKVKGDVHKAIATFQPHIPADLTQWTDVIRSDVRELFGQSKQTMGESPAGRRTKFEMQMVNTGKELRMDERRDIVGTALTKVVRKLNQIIFSRWDANKVAQVVGVDGAKYWVEYDMSQIKGEYQIKVDVESMTPSTKGMKKREIVELIQALGKNPRANIDYLMRMLLREYEWVDAMQVLPEAQETQAQPLGQKEFMQQQQQLMGNREEFAGRAKANAESVGRYL